VNDIFEEYLREKEPQKKAKGYAWHTAIGLQAVDGLSTSDYLIETAKKNIDGDITFEEANNLIYNAVLSGQAGGYGYGLLSPIACNAIFEYRDIYLRPDFYVAAEADVRNLLADLIAKVETGMDYEEARKEAYTRIYRSVDPNFDPSEREMTDFCYWDTPAVDSAMFNRARKVLLEAEAKYKTQFNVQ
jgi:hypothetical protein